MVTLATRNARRVASGCSDLVGRRDLRRKRRAGPSSSAVVGMPLSRRSSVPNLAESLPRTSPAKAKAPQPSSRRSMAPLSK